MTTACPNQVALLPDAVPEEGELPLVQGKKPRMIALLLSRCPFLPKGMQQSGKV